MTLTLVYGGVGGHNDADNGYDSNDDNSDELMMITLDIAVEHDLTYVSSYFISLYLISPVCSLNNGFLVADMSLHLAVSVGPSVPPSATLLNYERFSHYSSCPTVRDWIAVFPALF